MTPHSPTTADTARSERPAVRRLVVPLVFAATAAVVLVADQWSKAWAEATLPLLEQRPLLGPLLHLRLLYNSGAAFGMGAGITPVVTAVQILISAAVIVYMWRTVRSLGWTVALGLVLGGALGNIHDRLLRPPGPFRGEVVDFLELPNWPVFNVADMAVVTGAVLVVLLSVLGVPAEGSADEEPAARQATDDGPEGQR
ncbi:signal peptidase II [Brachybacterium sp. EF45031]|uniref:signal peptidase II n=1 Tax=Brachybacterium sillae TaxID=2810536 RepID=UPI00217E4B46|nr:signal peptidase II [Brachybacterium sillae]MCS6712411.1 signal peptidase II [Brachybacterium sillae]